MSESAYIIVINSNVLCLLCSSRRLQQSSFSIFSLGAYLMDWKVGERRKKKFNNPSIIIIN